MSKKNIIKPDFLKWIKRDNEYNYNQMLKLIKCYNDEINKKKNEWVVLKTDSSLSIAKLADWKFKKNDSIVKNYPSEFVEFTFKLKN